MNTEVKLNETTFIVSTEIATDLASIAEHLKNKVGVTLSNEQVIQHLVHMFKTMNLQGMPFNTFPTFQPAQSFNPNVPGNPLKYPPGVMCVNPGLPEDPSEYNRNKENSRNKLNLDDPFKK